MKNKKYKQKMITFYDKDKDIYELACKLNFQGFVKGMLRAIADEAKSAKALSELDVSEEGM